MSTPAPTREDLRGVIARVIERLETIAPRRGQREAVDADDEDGMEGLRRAAGGRGTFARIDEKGAGEDNEEQHAAVALRLSSRGLVAELRVGSTCTRGCSSRRLIAMRWAADEASARRALIGGGGH